MSDRSLSFTAAFFREIAGGIAQECRKPGSVYFDREPSQALSAADVLAAKLDREPWSGRVHDAIKLAVAEQILRSIRDEQIGASSGVKALADSYFEATK